MPEFDGRKQIILNLMRKQQNSLTEEEIDYIAKLTDGYSGADMTNLCREAGILLKRFILKRSYFKKLPRFFLKL